MSGQPRPLLVTDDATLLDDVLRLAAAADVDVEVAHASAHARGSWTTAPLVLVGGDMAADMARSKPRRRAGVVLVGDSSAGSDPWQQAVDLGAEHVAFLPEAESWLADRMADAAEGNGNEANTLCVLGGRGGAGASTLAAALALTGARSDLRTLLVDGDPLGGGIDLVLGSEDVRGSRWSDFLATRGRVSGAALHGALPQLGALQVLSWQRDGSCAIPAPAMRSVLGAAQRGSDLVVLDLPRWLDEASEEALRRCTAALLVVPAEVRATVAAARVSSGAARHAADLRTVVRGPAPSGLSASAIAESLGLPLAGEIRAENGLAAAVDRGEAPTRNRRGPLAQFCRSYIAGLSGHGLGTGAVHEQGAA